MPSSLRSEEHTSELQSHLNLVCRLLLEKTHTHTHTHKQTPRPSISHEIYTHTTHTLQLVLSITTTRAHPHSRTLIHCIFFFKDTGAHKILPFSPPHPLPI